MPEQTPDFFEILKVLSKYKVDYIIVGGVCAVLHGAPVSTFDLDLVHSRNQNNIDSLLSALEELDAYYRGRGDQRLKPGIPHLSSPGHQLLMTEYGPLDLLGTIGVNHSYDELIRDTEILEVSGYKVRVLNLDTLIKVKKETISDKDKFIIPILERTLREKQKK